MLSDTQQYSMGLCPILYNISIGLCPILIYYIKGCALYDADSGDYHYTTVTTTGASLCMTLLIHVRP